MSTVDVRSDRAYWERRYAEWWDRPFHGICEATPLKMALEELRISAKLEAVLRPHHVVLDAACGYGRLAPIICPRVAWYVGVDFAGAAIEEARASAPPNATYVVGDILDFIHEPFDVIVMVAARSSLGRRADAHLRSLLKPDGWLLVFGDTGDEVIGP